MKRALLALAAIVVLGGSSFALVQATGAQTGTTQAAECGPCDPENCTPCPGPCR